MIDNCLTAQARMHNVFREIKQRKSKHFSTLYYGSLHGEFLGYLESDEHLRKRILKEISRR